MALAENNAKFVPRPSQLAPSGCGEPAEICPLPVLRNEKDGSERWDNNAKLRTITCCNGGYRPGVPDIASAIDRGIGIEYLSPLAGERHAHTIIVQDLRREIHDDHATFARLVALAQPGKGAVAGIVGDQPFEAGGIAIERVQRRQCRDRAG